MAGTAAVGAHQVVPDVELEGDHVTGAGHRAGVVHVIIVVRRRVLGHRRATAAAATATGEGGEYQAQGQSGKAHRSVPHAVDGGVDEQVAQPVAVGTERRAHVLDLGQVR